MMFKNNPRRKKGEDMLVDFWAILMFTLVMIIFLLVFILTKEGAEKDNILQERFINSDLDYMLNSYIKAPYIKDVSKTNGEIIIEDYLNNDFSRTDESFEKFFLGINTTNNNPIGEFNLVVTESKTIMHISTVDPITNGYTADKLYGGVLIVEKYSKITIPNRDGADIDVLLKIEYVMMKEKPIE